METKELKFIITEHISLILMIAMLVFISLKNGRESEIKKKS